MTLATTEVPVEPGGQATVAVTVRNRSSIVEGFRLDVVGDAAAWATFHPDEVEIRPQEEAEALLVFAPPAATGAHAGAVPFGVRAVSQVDPATSTVAEGDLQVGSVAQSQVTITPVTSKGRFSARHRIEVANWGNAPVRLALSVSDPDEAVGFLLHPDVLDLPIGTSGRARLRVRARKPMLRGVPVRRPFKVVARPVAPGASAPAPGPTPAFGHDPTQPSVDGAFEQRPVLGRGIIPLAIATGADLGVIAVVLPYNIEDVNALQRALAHRDQLRADGFANAGVLDTTDYPALANATGNYYYDVFIPGFSSEDEAGAFCQANGLGTCLTYDLRKSRTSPIATSSPAPAVGGAASSTTRRTEVVSSALMPWRWLPGFSPSFTCSQEPSS